MPGRFIEWQALLGILPKDSSDVTRVEFQHFANIVKTKKPIFIPVKDPFRGFREDPLSASRFGRTILEIAVNRILQHGCDQSYLRCMSGIAPVDMEILVDNDNVGLTEEISCLFSTEEIFRDVFTHKSLFVQHNVLAALSLVV